ncbi:S8 family peptidase [Qipengyuania vesicularis]|uniref:S8 family peptidase n=1 Tax=Qipengyuania vesicularis TaxID=2867232 RepID=UPI001C886F12|nr:S8 family peptidase [Qipengyuania vesicularis]MBX7528540.1 S8 family serine peptidase [Qipengyuania vesicularis]
MAYKLMHGSAAIAIATVMCVPAAAQEAHGSAENVGAAQTSAETQSEDETRVTVRSTPLDPLYGKIDPFYGKIDAFWDDISPFYGKIDPFYGKIDPFYGKIDPFWDDISPFYGDISAFWGRIDAFWGNIDAFDAGRMAALGDFWSQTAVQFGATDTAWAALAQDSGNVALQQALAAQLDQLVAQSEAHWGELVAQQTGQDFQSIFVDAIFARHGIDPSDPASLAALSANQRSAFFVDWHDSLMGYSGIDHVDHWMGGINWTPSITQIQGAGHQTTIGILDSAVTGSDDLADNVVSSTGSTAFVSGHGAGVASLLVGAHDGVGVMGIAPNARVVAHNPFDETETASWEDVREGIIALNVGGASIINLSLGEPGTPLSAEWRGIFNDSRVFPHSNTSVYVLAAGNDGVAQTNDVEWAGAFSTSFILVGSVSPDGSISGFSNTPGNACLLNNGVCSNSSDLGQGGLLMNRFIVAPGEMLLVDDGHGGYVRRSGTSFSAPLVSGAIALLHDRWPWLANNPEASVEIILRSARDLGAPGVDEVYGVGMLDVLASQSPLDFNDTYFRMYQRYGSYFYRSDVSASYLLSGGVPSWWETSDVFFTMYEDVGTTYRDFAVPMSTYTTGKRTNALGGGYKRLQDFVSDRFARWIRSGGSDSQGDGVAGISQIAFGADHRAGNWSLQYSAIMPRLNEEGVVESVHSGAKLTDPAGRFALTLGHGQGAMALAGERFGIVSDFDRDEGGVNPILGFASGEVFTAVSFAPSEGTRLRIGYSENSRGWEDIPAINPVDRYLQGEFGDQRANALTMDLEQKVSDSLSLNVQYTHLDEANALLGVQTDNDMLLGEGARTEALTLSGTIGLGAKLRLDLSATVGKTELAEGQFLANASDILSTAGQLSLTGTGVFESRDSLRLTLGQPLQIEDGSLAIYSLEVVDRETGETGIRAQEIGIATKRRIMGELVYAAPLGDAAELGVFGRYVSEGSASPEDGVMLGINLGKRF